MNWLDLVIIIILAILAYAGYKQGIIKSVLSVAILLISFIVASIITPLIYGRIISNEDFMASCTSIIEEKLNIPEFLDGNIELEVNEDLKNASIKDQDMLTDGELWGNENITSQKQIDEILKRIEKEFHIPSSVMKKVRKELKELNPSNIKGQVVTQVSDVIAEAIARMIIQSLCFTVIYILLFFSLRIVSSMLNIISRFPVIKEVNMLAGAGLGLVEGILVLWIIGTLLFSLVNAFGLEGIGNVLKGSLFMKLI